MNCTQAKADIALWIGEDLPDRSRRDQLRRHVSACADCRRHYKRLKGTLQVLEHADREQTYDVSDSVWPELARRIEQKSEARSRGARFNGWLPFVAMTAACAALVVVMETQGRRDPASGGNRVSGDVFQPFYPRSHQPDASTTRSSDSNPVVVPTVDVTGDATVPQAPASADDGAGRRAPPTIDTF